ncbi:MAG: hypothetical protein OXQ84_10755 [bacterium]|nr:hypothetical protein [bacterium]
MTKQPVRERGIGEVAVGTKVELWEEGGPVGWGQVAAMLTETEAVIDRWDEDETYTCDVAGDGGEVYVDDWSPPVRDLMAERMKERWQEAGVESWRLAGGGAVAVGTKLEITDESGPADWGEVTQLLAGRRVAVYWYDGADTSIAGVDDGTDLYVDDWSPQVYGILRERAARGGHGEA